MVKGTSGRAPNSLSVLGFSSSERRTKEAAPPRLISPLSDSLTARLYSSAASYRSRPARLATARRGVGSGQVGSGRVQWPPVATDSRCCRPPSAGAAAWPSHGHRRLAEPQAPPATGQRRPSGCQVPAPLPPLPPAGAVSCLGSEVQNNKPAGRPGTGTARPRQD